VPGGVDAVDGVVVGIAIPVETLAVARLGDDRVRREESRGDRIAITRVAELQLGLVQCPGTDNL
jgi:hypothetical protein